MSQTVCSVIVVMILGSTTGCASSNSYWSSAPPQKLFGKCDGQKYEREGHFHTTDLVGEMAGLDKNKRDRLAYFSQAPDDLAFKYSATSVAFWGIVPPHLSYRSNIINVLHSLHGGSHKEIISRREKLKE